MLFFYASPPLIWGNEGETYWRGETRGMGATVQQSSHTVDTVWQSRQKSIAS